MDEDTEIINQATRLEKINKFFIEYKIKIIILIILIFALIIGYFFILEIKERNKMKVAELYNKIVLDYEKSKNKSLSQELVSIINKNDSTYSPLALYFIIDNNIITDADEINLLFDRLVTDIKSEKEIKNLIIYKKALYNSDNASENELLNTLKPILNSESIWKSHSLYLLGEYFYFKKEKEKSKEFFLEIISLDNANPDIKLESQKKLNRDFK